MDALQHSLTPASELAKPPRLELVRVLERYRYIAGLSEQGYSSERLKNINRVLRAVTACRTGRMGSHVYECHSCQRNLIGLNSCGDRHCSCCGGSRRDEWRERMIGWNLDCDYFHVVFTLPHVLNPLILVNPLEMYKLLMRSAIDVLTRTCDREFDCQPGIAVVLHTWGQRMNLHVHVHVVLTAGGLTADGDQWKPIDATHPALSNEALSPTFQKMFQQRLFHRLTRNSLLWPTRQEVPADSTAIGLRNYHEFDSVYGPADELEAAEQQTLREQALAAARLAAEPRYESPVGEPLFPEWSVVALDDQTVTTADTASPLALAIETAAIEASVDEVPSRAAALVTIDSRVRQRDLTGAEGRLLKVLKRKQWIVNSQPPPEGKRGPAAVINYLACYVTGACISDARLISDEDGQVTIRIQDYAAGDKKLETFAGPEIVRRFVLHILPRTLGRVRYAGIFAAAGRAGRLEKVRRLIAEQKGKLPSDAGERQASLFDEFEQPVSGKALAAGSAASDSSLDQSLQQYKNQEQHHTTSNSHQCQDEEPAASALPLTAKCCNRCQAKLELVGTLRGAETTPLVKLADKIDKRLEEQAPMFRIELMAMIVSLFHSFWRVDQLPHAVRDLLANRKLTYVESSALSALLERKISEPVYPKDEDDLSTTSGIPPPENLF